MKQLRLEIDNLCKGYREERLFCTQTGSSSLKLPYDCLLHNLLGCLPINDEFLVEENIEVSEVTELAEGGQVIGSWEDSLAFESDSDVVEPAATTTANRDAIPDPACPPSCSIGGPAGHLNATTGSGKNNDDANVASKLSTGRKRPATIVQTLLHRHNDEMLHVRKSEKERRKLIKKVCTAASGRLLY
ncbi:uncharacterized protein LOC142581844 [Dermacentor variabilis]|uniref:uncharacterized protein LOC142581844 n=1 Tax=Dermacentor variabilis TaxID=34621 RepID=UPI003F5BF532